MVVYCRYNYDHYATMMNLIMLITFIIIVAIVIITISISMDIFAKQARKCWMAEGQRKGQESRFAKWVKWDQLWQLRIYWSILRWIGFHVNISTKLQLVFTSTNISIEFHGKSPWISHGKFAEFPEISPGATWRCMELAHQDPSSFCGLNDGEHPWNQKNILYI